jgi:phosphocarrier protein FPr
MVGLVVVSHSSRLAEGVVELAAQMAGPEVRMGAAGGLDEPGGALGTDAAKVLRAIDDVWSEDGVLVLMDLGSAVLSAGLALDLLDEARRARVRLTPAPLVEGAVAAAVSAGVGDPLEAVAAAARGGLAGKESQLAEDGDDEAAAQAASGAAGTAQGTEGAPGAHGPSTETLVVTVRNALGLHARPAALLVRMAAGFDALVLVKDTTNGRGPVSARSLNGVATLGARQGDELVVSACGTDAAEALNAVRRLADEGFGELGEGSAEALAGAAPPASARTAAGQRRPEEAAETAAEAIPPPAGAVLTGLPAAPGVASGPARRLPRTARTLPQGLAADPDAEWSALQRALTATAAEIRRAQAGVAGRASDEDAAIFGAHLLFLEDEALLEPARDAVFARNESAARAWAEAVAAAAAEWDTLEDAYQRARAADLRAVGDQVLANLAGAGPAAGAHEPGGSGPAAGERGTAEQGDASEPAEAGAVPGIIVADDLSPADVAGLDPATVAGVACAFGGPTSHAVILARALGLPAVVGAGAELLAIPPGTPLALDGDAGTVTVAPSVEALAAVERRRDALAREAAAARGAAATPAVTLDGVTVRVEANIAGPRDVPDAVAAGADGVGLLRTEFLFLGAAAMPDEDEQAAAYEAVAAALEGRPLTIRTLDAGADKPLSYLPTAAEANPFLGVRGLRLSLRHPEQLLCQLRALLRVAAARPLRVMLPMVSTVEEVRSARELLAEAREALEARGVAVPARLELGIMLEVPSAALVAEHLAPLVDFFSVGTNDLTQYAMAAERGNSEVAALADPLHPAVLRLVERTVSAAAEAGRTVAVCGEVAGDRLAVPLLVGLGVRELSMSHTLIPAAKQAVRATDARAAGLLAQAALAAESAAAVRRLLAAAAAGPPASSDLPSATRKGRE